MRPRKYKLNENYFAKIDTATKAYFLGFLFADGSIRKYHISFELHIKDSYIQKQFLKNIYIKKQPPISYKILMHRKYSRINICSKILTDNLRNEYNLQSNKSFIIRMPNLGKLSRHFIRGYFDGDGTIYFNKKINKYYCSFISNEQFLTDLKNILEKENIKTNKIIVVAKHSKIKKFNIDSGKSLFKLYKYLYNNSNNLYLKRKKIKFEKLFLKLKNTSKTFKEKYSKTVGVSFDKNRNLWTAYYGKKIQTRHKTEQEAISKRIEYEKKLLDKIIVKLYN